GCNIAMHHSRANNTAGHFPGYSCMSFAQHPASVLDSSMIRPTKHKIHSRVSPRPAEYTTLSSVFMKLWSSSIDTPKSHIKTVAISRKTHPRENTSDNLPRGPAAETSGEQYLGELPSTTPVVE